VQERAAAEVDHGCPWPEGADRPDRPSGSYDNKEGGEHGDDGAAHVHDRLLPDEASWLQQHPEMRRSTRVTRIPGLIVAGRLGILQDGLLCSPKHAGHGGLPGNHGGSVALELIPSVSGT
jgi:hypothetical protein